MPKQWPTQSGHLIFTEQMNKQMNYCYNDRTEQIMSDWGQILKLIANPKNLTNSETRDVIVSQSDWNNHLHFVYSSLPNIYYKNSL